MLQNLTDDEKLLLKAFKENEPHAVDDDTFARILLRGSARNFVEARDAYDNERIPRADFLQAERELRRHAVMYAREALRVAIDDNSIDHRDDWESLMNSLVEMHGDKDDVDTKLVAQSKTAARSPEKRR